MKNPAHGCAPRLVVCCVLFELLIWIVEFGIFVIFFLLSKQLLAFLFHFLTGRWQNIVFLLSSSWLECYFVIFSVSLIPSTHPIFTVLVFMRFSVFVCYLEFSYLYLFTEFEQRYITVALIHKGMSHLNKKYKCRIGKDLIAPSVIHCTSFLFVNEIKK